MQGRAASSGGSWGSSSSRDAGETPEHTSDCGQGAAPVGDPGSIPGLGRPPGESHGQRSLGPTVHEVAESRTRLRGEHFGCSHGVNSQLCWPDPHAPGLAEKPRVLEHPGNLYVPGGQGTGALTPLQYTLPREKTTSQRRSTLKWGRTQGQRQS